MTSAMSSQPGAVAVYTGDGGEEYAVVHLGAEWPSQWGLFHVIAGPRENLAGQFAINRAGVEVPYATAAVAASRSEHPFTPAALPVGTGRLISMARAAVHRYPDTSVQEDPATFTIWYRTDHAAESQPLHYADTTGDDGDATALARALAAGSADGIEDTPAEVAVFSLGEDHDLAGLWENGNRVGESDLVPLMRGTRTRYLMFVQEYARYQAAVAAARNLAAETLLALGGAILALNSAEQILAALTRNEAYSDNCDQDTDADTWHHLETAQRALRDAVNCVNRQQASLEPSPATRSAWATRPGPCSR